MKPFEYASPTDLNQVAPLLGNNWNDAAILAGGTDLIALMKDEIVSPKRVVNVKTIKPLNLFAIQPLADSTTISVGALSRLQELADNVHIRKAFPALTEALDDAASPQIRNMATIAGNLLQRPRCWYYRNGFGLLALDKDGESLVRKGDSRYHAILGNDGPALFVSPSTIAPILIACNAKVGIFGTDGKTRRIPLQELYRIPRQEGEREHTIAPGELITDVIFSTLRGTKTAIYEVRQKHAFDWPIATTAVALTVVNGKVQSARVVMGHVAPIPWLSKEAEDALVGKPINEQTAEAAGAAAVKNAKSLGHNSHKIQCAKVAVKRAILKAAGLPVA